MSAKSTYHFGDRYELRPADPRYREMAEQWVSRDPDHWGTDPAFWFEQAPGRDSYLLFDPEGPLFFFKLASSPTWGTIEIHIQFGPSETLPQRERTARGLREGMEWLENRLSGTSINALVFRSTKPELIIFCVRRLGFKSEDGLLTKSISKRVEVT